MRGRPRDVLDFIDALLAYTTYTGDLDCVHAAVKRVWSWSTPVSVRWS